MTATCLYKMSLFPLEVENIFRNKIWNQYGISECMFLTIFVDNDDQTLKNKYIEAAERHNNKWLNDDELPQFYDAGFDLFTPNNSLSIDVNNMYSPGLVKIDFQVKCCAQICKYLSDGFQVPTIYTPFYTYGRSSISNSPFRLANNQGIIDAGYRGNLIGKFDQQNKDTPHVLSNYLVANPYSRLLQICAPKLMPILVQVVDSFDQLGPRTSRGDNGFGSTGN